MEKVITGPDAGDDLGAGETAFSESVAVRHDDHVRVHVSGMTSETPDPDVETQTRSVLERIRSAIAEHGGAMADIVRVRVYVAHPHLTQANFEAIHAARRAFFEPGAYPASTLVEVERLIRDGRVVEIDADAVVPTDGWD